MPQISQPRVQVGLGDILPIRTTWHALCRTGMTLDNLDYLSGQDPTPCKREAFTVHQRCDHGCVELPAVRDTLVTTELGPLMVEVELRTDDDRYESALGFQVAAPDPGSLSVSCSTAEQALVLCADPAAARVHVWASVSQVEYYVYHLVVDGRPMLSADGVPIDPDGMTVQLGDEQLRLEDPATYPDKHIPQP